MRILYLINLFIIYCSSLIIKPSKIPVKYKYSRISIDNYNNNSNQLILRKPLIINNPSNFSFILLIILVYIHIFIHI